MQTLAILFAGLPTTAVLTDGSKVKVFVRALPERYVLEQFLQVMEKGAATIELCTYVKAEKGKAPAGAHPEIPSPTGYWPVPPHWADNLSDDSQVDLYELAKKLNLARAVRMAEGRLTAKKELAPLNARIMQQVTPLVVSVLKELLPSFSTSTPSAPSSSAVGASSS